MVLLDAGLGDYTPGNTQTGKGCLMGVDIGTRNHVVIRQRHEDRLQAVYIGEVDDIDELDAFMQRYQIRAAVVDALPETRKAQEFAARFEGRVYVAYYPTQPRGVKRASPYQWSEDENVVNIDRSRAFDGVLAGYYNKQYENPADAPTIKDYYLHLRNLVRVKEDLPDGTPVVRYLKLGQTITRTLRIIVWPRTSHNMIRAHPRSRLCLLAHSGSKHDRTSARGMPLVQSFAVQDGIRLFVYKAIRLAIASY